MNCDLLDRFVVIGGPFIDPGPNLQSQLQEQVLFLLKQMMPCMYQAVGDINIKQTDVALMFFSEISKLTKAPLHD